MTVELEIEGTTGLENTETQTDTTEAPEQEQPSWAEDKFVAGGKEIKATREQIIKWAQMGYNYPQEKQKLNLERQTWEKQLNDYKTKEQTWSEAEQKWGPYKEVDEYAAKNPDWWQQVQAAYKEKIGSAETNPEIKQLKDELAELKQFRDQLTQEKQSQKIQEEDSQLSQEVESIRKSFPNLDFQTPDEDGKNLEMKILEHADKIGASSFRVAFRDFYHEHLINKAKEEGKELVSKELQKQTKLGILGESPKSTKGASSGGARDMKKVTYGDLAQEAVEMLKSMRTS